MSVKALAVAALIAAASHAAPAQEPLGKAPSRGPGWLPRRSRLYANGPYSRAEMVEVLARLEAIERIVAKSGAFEHPDGFEIEPNLSGGGDADILADGTRKLHPTVIGYGYELAMYAPTKKTAGEGTSCVRIAVNGPAGANKLPYSNGAGDIFTEWDHGDPVPGATSVWNRLSPTARSWVDVMFTSGGAPFWKTVTRAAFLDAVLVQMQGDPQAMAAARAAAKSNPSIAGELSVMEKPIASVRAQIAAMSAAERSMPAWLDRHAVPEAFPLVAPNADTAVRVLQFDSDFFRARRSRVEARSIHVHLSASLTCEMPAIRRAVYDALERLDWAAFAQLLEP